MKWFKSLDKEFIGRADMKGFSFKQLEINDKSVLYQVTNGNNIHYEVFKNKGRYPFTKAFGAWAWCTSDKDRAYGLYEKLISMDKFKSTSKSEGLIIGIINSVK